MAKYKKTNIPIQNITSQPNKPKNAPKKDKKKIATIILAFLMLLWTIGSIFGLIGGIKSVSADTSTTDTTFTGSTIAIPYVLWEIDTNDSNNYGAFFFYHMEQVKLTFSSANTNVGLKLLSTIRSNRGIFETSLDISRENHLFFDDTYSNNALPVDYLNPYYRTLSFNIFISNNTSFNSNIIGVMLYNTSRTIGDSVYYTNCIRYLSSNGGFLDIQFVCCNMDAFWVNDWSDVKNRLLLTPRTYFFGDSNSDSADYDLGYTEGFLDGSQDGYDSGYANGLIVGREQGYQNGINDSNQYSFLNLLGAVVDAPLQALTGLLNFDLLGFNMFNFVMAIFTLSLIVIAIKLFL